MRVLLIALLALVLATPVWAQTSGGSSVGHNFGGVNCPQKVPCPLTADSLSSEGYVMLGNSCVTQSFGFTNPDGFFQSSGLDGNSCLTTKPNALPKLASTRTEPHCCIVQSNDTCTLHCDLIGAQ